MFISGEFKYLGIPPLSPVNEGSKAKDINPLSAIFIAYNHEDCSLTAPNGPHTAIADNFPVCSFGSYKSPTNVIPYLLWKVIFLRVTF